MSALEKSARGRDVGKANQSLLHMRSRIEGACLTGILDVSLQTCCFSRLSLSLSPQTPPPDSPCHSPSHSVYGHKLSLSVPLSHVSLLRLYLSMPRLLSLKTCHILNIVFLVTIITKCPSILCV